MAAFVDGPAEGLRLSLRRCPMYLRLVLDRSTGGWDALDQPDDAPRESEDVYVYEILPHTWSQVFVRPGGRYESGSYRHRDDVDVQGGRASLREAEQWRDWASDQPAIEMA